MNAPITLTDSAVKAIKEKMAQKDDAIGLRVRVKSTGCSGKSYVMEFVTAERPEADDRIEQGGAVLFIPKTDSWMMFGMEIGYEESALHSGFTFSNPNETGRCGCGESFSVDRP